MASKKPIPFEHPPQAESSSDDVDEELEDDSEESEEEEEQHTITKIPSTEKKPDPKAESSDDDGSDSGSDSDTTPPAPELTLKQIASATPVSKSAKKRPVEISDVKNAKKFKKVSEVEDEKKKKPAEVVEEEEVRKVGEDSKKQLFQRLFSEEDEIQVLKGMLDYAAKKGVDPAGDLNCFHDYVKRYIHVDVTSAQLNDKIRRLRKKFVKNLSKSKKKGADRSFSRLHERVSYDLSKKIWGAKNVKADGDVNDSGGFEVKSNGKGKRTPKPSMTPDQKEKHASSLQIPLGVKIEKVQHVHHNGSSSSLSLTELIKSRDAAGMGLSDEFFKKGLELLDDEVKAEFEKKWKALLLAEAELYHKRMELNREQMKLILDAYKASGR